MRALPLLYLTTLVACDTEDTGDTSDPGVVWSVEHDDDARAWSGVWGTGPDDVWIVGGDADGGATRHYDGSAWSDVPVPSGTGLLVWVYGFASDDVYAVGRAGALVHWDGAAWAALESGTDRDLWGVWGASSTDLWLVGGEVTGTWPLSLHWDGAAATEVPIEADQNLHGGVALFKVWGIGDDTWAVGDLGLVLRWDGTRWNENFGGEKANDDFVSLWGEAADDVVAVGGRGNGRIARWDGSGWTTTMPDALTGLNAVYVQDGLAFVGGIYGYTGTLDLADGALVGDPVAVTDDVHAIWADGADAVWAVGGVFTAPYRGFLLRRGAP